MRNKSLNIAQNFKKDEFYTMLSTIEDEVSHYVKHFENKIVYLNCDDPRISNFYKYFTTNFHKLKLKKLITSFYIDQSVDLFNINDVKEKPFWIEYNGELNKNNEVPQLTQLKINYFNQDGDFRSEEAIELLKQADIVCTNPPFSLFREFIAQLVEYDKKFLVLGNMNAITYKEIFPLIQNNQMWPGYLFNKFIPFEVPEHYETDMMINDKKIIKVSAITWWTNLEHSKRHTNINLTKSYKNNEHIYQKYDNFDAINIDRLPDIPIDYDGLIGVPITFIGQWNPNQFKIVGLERYTVNPEHLSNGRFTVNGKALYARILVKKINDE